VDPWNLAINPVTNFVYVANQGSNTVSVINGTTNSVVSTLNVGIRPTIVRVNSVTNRIYVTNQNSNDVSVIDGTTNTVIATVNVGTMPSSIRINPNTNLIYVTNQNSNNVSVIDGVTNSIVSTIIVGIGPTSVQVNSNTNRIYVINQFSNSLSVIDGATNTLVTTVNIGMSPVNVQINSITNLIYVTNEMSNNVSVIDGSSNAVLATVTVGNFPVRSLINSATNHLFVVNYNSNTVSVIDGSNNSVLTTLSVGFNPEGSALNVNTNRIYVCNYGDGTISVIQDGSSSANTTNVVLSSSNNPTTFGQSVTFTTTVNPIPDGGTVQFEDNGNNLGNPVSINASGQATCTSSSLPAGNHAITALYSGDGNFSSSTGTLTQIVNQAPVTVTLTSNVYPWVSGQPMILTATVTPVMPETVAPTGTVTFVDGTTTLGTSNLNTSGQAVFNISTLSAGSHTFVATYSGDANYSGNTNYLGSGNTLTEIVNQASSQVTVSLASPYVSGQPVQFIATVKGQLPATGYPSGGTIQFKVDGTNLGDSATLSNGTATSPSITLTGIHVIEADYSGDSNYYASVGSLFFNPGYTYWFNLTSTANPSSYGEPVSFSYSVSVIKSLPPAITATGTIQFEMDGQNWGNPVSLSNGSATSSTISLLSLGSHVITAIYSGDSNFQSDTRSVTQRVVQSMTTTTLTSTGNPSIPEQAVSITATVTAPFMTSTRPTGTVQFQINDTNYGSPAVLSNGIATLGPISFPNQSQQSITAIYTPDTANYAGSTGILIQNVMPHTNLTGTSLTSSPNSSTYGGQVTLTAIVSAIPSSAGIPTGTVTFSSGTLFSQTISLDTSGTAVATTSTLPVGINIINATYNGDANFGSSSATTSQTVNPSAQVPTQMSALVVSWVNEQNQPVYSQQITLTTTLTSVPPSAGIPAGTVTFQCGSINLGTATLDNQGNATLTTLSLPAGTDSLTATFNGGARLGTYFETCGSPISTPLVINPAATSMTLNASANPVVFSQPIVFTATIKSLSPATATPTGSVQFQIDGTNFGSSVSLSNGVAATGSISNLTVGTHTVFATYTPDANFLASAGVIIASPSQYSTIVTVTSSYLPAGAMEPVIFTAVVQANQASGTPTGTVQFQIDGTDFGSPVALSNGSAASVQLCTRITGNHNITAVYSGDTNFTASTGGITEPIVAPSWDVNGDHVCDVLDLIMEGNHIGETGTSGWITEDINRDGVINVLDLINVGDYMGLTWQ
jgi:YVTN family beta-propeller protein